MFSAVYGSARRAPADLAAAEFDPGRLVAFRAGHHAVVEVDQHTVGGMAVLGDRRRPRLERRHEDARLRRVEPRRDRGRRGRILRRQAGGQQQRERYDESWVAHEAVYPNIRALVAVDYLVHGPCVVRSPSSAHQGPTSGPSTAGAVQPRLHASDFSAAAVRARRSPLSCGRR